MFLMAWNTWKTSRGAAAYDAPVPLAAPAHA
jgi:hypothetical protein